MFIGGTHQAQTDRESRGYVQVFPALPNVAPPNAIKFVLTSQEQPFHPGPIWWPALPNVARAGVVRYVTTAQEQPYHPPPDTWNFIQVVRASSIEFLETTQESPYHPGSSTSPAIGLAAVVIGVAPGVRYFTTVQESPYHPGPLAWPALPNVSGAGVVRYLTTSQEFPFHPLPSRWSFIQVVRPPTVVWFATLQEAPFQPGSSLVRSFVGAPAVSPVRYLTTSQELPPHPGPRLTPSFITVPVIFVPPGVRFFDSLQEGPFHPGAVEFPWPGVFGNPAPTPPPSNPATYYMLEDYWTGSQYLQAGTIQTTADLGGALPLNWVPNPNVDPVDAGAVAAYSAVGYRARGLTRTQFASLPVRPPNYDWQMINNEWVLVKVRNNF